MYGNSPFSYSPRGFSQEDFNLQRRTFHNDDLKPSPLQRNDMSRPSGRNIYMQRKEYSDKLNRQSDGFHVRVEHLFTCELDGRDLRTENDCVAKLKRLDAKGRLWPQDMIMEVQRGYLVLSDIETKTELDSMSLSSITQTKAVLESCAYDSVLTLTVQEHSKRNRQVFLFQCEETGAQDIKSDLDKMIRNGGSDDVEPSREDIRSHLENIIGQRASGNFRIPNPRPVEQSPPPSPLNHPPPLWGNREPVNTPPPGIYSSPEETFYPPDRHDLQMHEKAETERKTEILNHVLDDLDIFINKLLAVLNAPPPQEDKKKKKGRDKKNLKNSAPGPILPPIEEYIFCLQKVKYGFNLLGQLDGMLKTTSAGDYVHIFFNCLNLIVRPYPEEVPPTVLSPLLTEEAVGLINQVVSPEEDQLWRFLGECWNISRSQWTGPHVPPYIPEFYDGWQPPAPNYFPPSVASQSRSFSRSNSQRFPPPPQDFPDGPPPNRHAANDSWSPSPPPAYRSEPTQFMRVIYNFSAKNSQELSIIKDEVVQVISKSRRWWLVRNTQGQEGNVPQNVLEPMDGREPMGDLPRDNRGAVTLDMASSPAEVRAWLESKGFSRITVSSLGVLSGRLLLEMTRDQIKAVCPEEGAKVFFQLQGVRASVAVSNQSYDDDDDDMNTHPAAAMTNISSCSLQLASEPPRMYNGRY
ncbi:epidermal growth factor receptor kinase substrate 8-like protein 3b isoform X3 [Acanthochromis polyacanthus]|uniref:epidermal growth factor receptor kinase substrate 8-like protein 3b isoform X3 n=1 Tax=Acanthochromis polyacanthus TaxID=80966 RepID=UPI002234396C|nr:epidermal growth factor receptor kinase substrate 8-like protein 3b isoform X3 [Acanthochromis polyacanthus]